MQPYPPAFTINTCEFPFLDVLVNTKWNVNKNSHFFFQSTWVILAFSTILIRMEKIMNKVLILEMMLELFHVYKIKQNQNNNIMVLLLWLICKLNSVQIFQTIYHLCHWNVLLTVNTCVALYFQQVGLFKTLWPFKVKSYIECAILVFQIFRKILYHCISDLV